MKIFYNVGGCSVVARIAPSGRYAHLLPPIFKYVLPLYRKSNVLTLLDGAHHTIEWNRFFSTLSDYRPEWDRFAVYFRAR